MSSTASSYDDFFVTQVDQLDVRDSEDGDADILQATAEQQPTASATTTLNTAYVQHMTPTLAVHQIVGVDVDLISALPTDSDLPLYTSLEVSSRWFKFTSLTSITAVGQQFTDLSVFQQLPALQLLDLSLNDVSSIEVDTSVAEHTSPLHTLNLSTQRSGITEDNNLLQALTLLYPQLTSVDLSQNQLTSAQFGNTDACTRLRNLDLSGNEQLVTAEADAVWASLLSLPSLKSLNLGHCNISTLPTHLHTLTATPYTSSLKSLHQLDLSDNLLCDSTNVAEAVECFSALRLLDLTNNPLWQHSNNYTSDDCVQLYNAVTIQQGVTIVLDHDNDVAWVAPVHSDAHSLSEGRSSQQLLDSEAAHESNAGSQQQELASGGSDELALVPHASSGAQSPTVSVAAPAHQHPSTVLSELNYLLHHNNTDYNPHAHLVPLPYQQHTLKSKRMQMPKRIPRRNYKLNTADEKKHVFGQRKHNIAKLYAQVDNLATTASNNAKTATQQQSQPLAERSESNKAASATKSSGLAFVDRSKALLEHLNGREAEKNREQLQQLLTALGSKTQA